MESKSFRGKVNWMGLVCLFGGSSVFLVPGSPFAGSGLSLALKLIWIAFLALGCWMFLDTVYTIRNGQLLLRTAFFRPPMPNVQDIDAVAPFKSPYNNEPDLRIQFRKNGKDAFLVITPADKAGFIESLQANDPGLRSEFRRADPAVSFLSQPHR